MVSLSDGPILVNFPSKQLDSKHQKGPVNFDADVLDNPLDSIQERFYIHQITYWRISLKLKDRKWLPGWHIS